MLRLKPPSSPVLPFKEASRAAVDEVKSLKRDIDNESIEKEFRHPIEAVHVYLFEAQHRSDHIDKQYQCNAGDDR